MIIDEMVNNYFPEVCNGEVEVYCSPSFDLILVAYLFGEDIL